MLFILGASAVRSPLVAVFLPDRGFLVFQLDPGSIGARKWKAYHFLILASTSILIHIYFVKQTWECGSLEDLKRVMCESYYRVYIKKKNLFKKKIELGINSCNVGLVSVTAAWQRLHNVFILFFVAFSPLHPSVTLFSLSFLDAAKPKMFPRIRSGTRQFLAAALHHLPLSLRRQTRRWL